MEAEEDFKTAANRGAEQAPILRALDFDDVIVKGWRVFNLCRATTHDGSTCGLFYPGKLWSRPCKPKWQFYCKLDWEVLRAHSDQEHCAQWIRNLDKTFPTGWPEIGCGAKFAPWKRGPSMLAEILLESGEWKAFLCERPPTALLDAILSGGTVCTTQRGS